MNHTVTFTPTSRTTWWRAAGAAGLLGAGILIGAATSSPQTAWGEVQPPAHPEMFQSGSQVSVPILKDIATTLHQMDARLERLETLARQIDKRSN